MKRKKMMAEIKKMTDNACFNIHGWYCETINCKDCMFSSPEMFIKYLESLGFEWEGEDE